MVPKEAEVQALYDILDEDILLKLFVNNVTPDRYTTIGDLEEAYGGGYAPVVLKGIASGTPDWTLSDSDPNASAFAPPQLIVLTGSSDDLVYGYYYEGAVSGRLKGKVERFGDGPYLIPVAGELRIPVTPQLGVL